MNDLVYKSAVLNILNEGAELLRHALENVDIVGVARVKYEWGLGLIEACITDVNELPSALNNQVNLCDSCTYTYPECPSEKDDVIFGNGIGNDNICACNKYQPTVQPVATDKMSWT